MSWKTKLIEIQQKFEHLADANLHGDSSEIFSRDMKYGLVPVKECSYIALDQHFSANATIKHVIHIQLRAQCPITVRDIM